MKHEALLADAMLAVDRLHADTSVSQSTTRQSLEELRDHVDILIESLDHADECNGRHTTYDE